MDLFFVLKNEWKKVLVSTVLLGVLFGGLIVHRSKDLYEHNVVLSTGKKVNIVETSSGMPQIQIKPLVSAFTISDFVRYVFKKKSDFLGIKSITTRGDKSYLILQSRSLSLEKARKISDELIKELRSSFEGEVNKNIDFIKNKINSLKKLNLSDNRAFHIISDLQSALETPLIENLKILTEFESSKHPIASKTTLKIVASVFFAFFLSLFIQGVCSFFRKV